MYHYLKLLLLGTELHGIYSEFYFIFNNLLCCYFYFSPTLPHFPCSLYQIINIQSRKLQVLHPPPHGITDRAKTDHEVPFYVYLEKQSWMYVVCTEERKRSVSLSIAKELGPKQDMLKDS